MVLILGLQSGEDLSQPLQHLVCVPAQNYNIIEINQAYLPLQPHQNLIHQSLECDWCIAEAERHYIPLKKFFPSAEASPPANIRRLSLECLGCLADRHL